MLTTELNYHKAIETIQQEYTDSLGLIVQKDGDAGDTASREGIFYYLRSQQEGGDYRLNKAFDNSLQQLEIDSGIYIRHPYDIKFIKETYIYDKNQFSRDQTIPLIVAMGQFLGQNDRLHRLEKAQFNRKWYKFQNGDLLGPMEWNSYIRAFNYKELYIPVVICDLGLLVNAIIRVVKRTFYPNDTSDDVVLSLLFIQAHDRLPTPISWLARQVYKLSKPMKALDSYFNLESGASPLNDMYRPLMNKIGFK